MKDAGTKKGEDLTIFGSSIEDDVVGTWFARLGVLALLIGAAFGYRYAVDQGLIGPAARVALGALSGLSLLGFGHAARRKEWLNFAHALSGGGVAIVYLSVLAAQFRFDLISPAVALAMLSGVALLSAWLAVGYDSLSLAILATVGAFMNPFFLAADDPTAAMSYVVGVDVAVVYLAFYKRWSSLNKLAFVGSVAIASLTAGEATLVEGLGFASVLWILFTVIPFIQAARDDGTVRMIDVGLEVSVALLYLAAGLYHLWPSGPVDQGIFALVIGAAYALFALLAYSDLRTRAPLTIVMGALAVGFITLAAPLMTEGPVVPLIWGIEGTVLLYVGGATRNPLSKGAGGALIGIGLIGTIDAVSSYSPDRLLASPTSVVVTAEIAMLYLASWLVAQIADDDDHQETIRVGLLVAANLLTLGWLSREARFEVLRSVETAHAYATTQFVLSTLWATYSSVLVAVGVAWKQKWARYLGVATFGLILVKMLTVDLWQLEILQRTIAFVGLGVLMIACSFLYNRFRGLIVGTDA